MARTRPRYTAYVVPHTHWDRAWYLAFEQFRIRLVRLTENLLDLLDRKPSFTRFTLDGQTIVLEDALEIRPELTPRLRKHIRSGRLAIGPWYCLPDEYLVSGEALVRNLLIGHRIARRFGRVMKAGYIPDPFGHVSQMPQILAGFDLDSILFSRGVGEDGKRLGLEFRWLAPDGKTSVMACHQVTGYANLNAWGGVDGVPLEDKRVDVKFALERARRAIETLIRNRPTTRFLLLNNGSDHLPAQPSVPEMIRHVNGRLDNARLVQGTFEEFVRAVQHARPRLKTYQGELHDGKYHHLLSGVFSSRMYLKQANEQGQRQLEAYAEPLSAFAWLQGHTYPAGFLLYAWKELLKNHPHDDICGCSIDAVHQDMVHRFTHARQVADTFTDKSLETLVTHVGTDSGPEGAPVVIYNPTAWPRSETVSLKITVPADLLPSRTARVVDASGRPMNAVVCLSPRHDAGYWSSGHFGRRHVKDVEVEFLAEALPPVGLKTFFVTSGPPDVPKPRVKAQENILENEYLRVTVGRHGSVRIVDKKTRATVIGHVFEDTEDVGDEYDYSPLPKRASRTITSKTHARGVRVKVLEQSPFRATLRVTLRLRVPAEIAPDRQRRSPAAVDLPIQTVLSLQAGSRRLDFVTTVDNNAKDHRLRVVFQTPIGTNRVHAGSKFDVVTRPVEFDFGKDWVQPPVPTQHVDRFVSIDNGRIGLTLINQGLPEYEARRGRRGVTLCQTLFRSVGWLSNDNLVTRASHAGPHIETPGAQCPGPNTYHYSVVPHAGTWERAKTYVDAYNRTTPVLVRASDRHTGSLPLNSSFVRLSPDSLVLSAVKKAEEGNAVIVRFFNIASHPVKATAEFHRPVAKANLVNLNEKPIRPLPVRNACGVGLTVAPKGIVTLQITFRS